MLLALGPFLGQANRYQKEYLPEHAAALARDCKLHSGALTLFHAAGSVEPTLVRRARSFFGWYNTHAPDRTPSDLEFVSWAADVDVAPAPIFSPDVADQRIYATGFGRALGPRTLRYGDVVAGAKPYTGHGERLGVLRVDEAPEVSNADPGDRPVERAYVYTRVRRFPDNLDGSGRTTWESQPSAPSRAGFLAGEEDEVEVTLPREAYADDLGDGATDIYLYRTAVGQTTALFRFVGAASLDDLRAGSGRATSEGLRRLAVREEGKMVESLSSLVLGLPLLSQGNRVAPADMEGIIAAHNGIYAGFSGNTLHMSVPGAGWAWPADYDRRVDADRIVALAAVGESIVVMTEGYPWVFSGTLPESMVGRRLDTPAALPVEALRGGARQPGQVRIERGPGECVGRRRGPRGVAPAHVLGVLGRRRAEPGVGEGGGVPRRVLRGARRRRVHGEPEPRRDAAELAHDHLRRPAPVAGRVQRLCLRPGGRSVPPGCVAGGLLRRRDGAAQAADLALPGAGLRPAVVLWGVCGGGGLRRGGRSRDPCDGPASVHGAADRGGQRHLAGLADDAERGPPAVGGAARLLCGGATAAGREAYAAGGGGGVVGDGAPRLRCGDAGRDPGPPGAGAPGHGRALEAGYAGLARGDGRELQDHRADHLDGDEVPVPVQGEGGAGVGAGAGGPGAVRPDRRAGGGYGLRGPGGGGEQCRVVSVVGYLGGPDRAGRGPRDPVGAPDQRGHAPELQGGGGADAGRDPVLVQAAAGRGRGLDLHPAGGGD